MPKEVLPDDPVTFPEQILIALQRIVELVRRSKIDLLFLQL
jgi:hypothetical protein